MKKSIDHLLRATLDRGTVPQTSTECLDADTAAAFCDDALTARERSRVEAHVADCGRCQALLAALVRTSPPAARAWWRRPAIAWLAPLTAAATAVIVWVSVGGTPDVQPRQMATYSGTAPSEATVRPQETGDAPAARRSGRDSARPQERDRATAKAKPSGVRRESEVGGRAIAEGGVAGGFVGSATADAEKRADTAAVEKASPPAAPATESTVPQAPASAGAAATSTSAAAAPPPVDERATLRSASAPAVTRRLVAAQASEIISSNGVSRWRIGAGGVVQRSTDSGATWQTQSTGLNVAPTAGSSPSPSVCWLVGPAGLVIITADEGRTWQRLPFPVAIDLISIRATDDQSAVVVASDGRAFRTSDRGRNWR